MFEQTTNPFFAIFVDHAAYIDAFRIATIDPDPLFLSHRSLGTHRPQPQGFCYDTRLPGNGNGGHVYGTTLSAADKDDLIAYLLTF